MYLKACAASSWALERVVSWLGSRARSLADMVMRSKKPAHSSCMVANSQGSGRCGGWLQCPQKLVRHELHVRCGQSEGDGCRKDGQDTHCRRPIL